MKRSLFITVFTILLVWACPADAQYATGADSIVFVKLIHDYGTIAQGSDGMCEFVFTNKGNKPLILSNVRASCGCTAPTWPRAPILPGQKGTIKVGYNTQILGGFSKVVSVMSNASNSMVVLTIRGNVVPRN